jgi:hypothetical protein
VQVFCEGASVAVANERTVWSPKPRTCMNQGVMPDSSIVQRTYLESGVAPPAPDHAPPDSTVPNSMATSPPTMPAVWKPTRLRVATSRPAFSAAMKLAAGMLGTPVSSNDAARAQASAAFCSSVLVR